MQRTALLHLCLSVACSALAADVEPKTEHGWILADGQWEVTPTTLAMTKYCRHGVFAFRKDAIFSDTVFSAKFKVTERGKGVGAVGFVFRSVDSNHYYYVHYDTRNHQAILVAADAKKSWIEIARKGGLPYDMGAWHEGKVEARGSQIAVYLDGKLVLQAKDDRYPAGAVGFRIGQGQVLIEEAKTDGTPATLEKPWSYTKRDPRSHWPTRRTLPHQKVICEDAGAGEYEAFPDVCKLANGDLYCVFYAGYGHVARPNEDLPKGGRISYVRSSDGGLTWSKPGIVIDLDEDDRDPSVTQLPDGTMLCNFFQGRSVGRCFVTRSTDNGDTWDPKPVVVEPPPGLDKIYCSARILCLPDGTLLMPVYGNTNGVKNYASAIIRSRDGGKTWGDGTVIKDDRSHRYGHCEPALALMPDDTIVCHLRPCMCQTESKDFGRTWTTPHDLGFRGDAADLLLTSKGILITAHRYPGTSLHYSLDHGKTWSKNAQIDRVGGAYPSMVELDDGTVVCVYYEEGGGSSIRATRFKIDPKGVALVPWPKQP